MRILFSGSSSGGHIFPALALAEELSKKNDAEIFVLQTGNEDIDRQIAEKGFQIVPFKLRGISFIAFGKAFFSVFKLISASIHSLRILFKIKPDIVLGFGGYYCAPVVMVAHFLGIPTMIHEQNVVPGKANSILAKFVDKIAVSFKESIKYFRAKKVVFTGCPVRKDIIDATIEDARKRFNLNDEKFTIFIMGGSKGSHSINLKILDAVTNMRNKEKLRIIHVAGHQDYDFVLREYSKMKIDALVFAFLKEIGYAYKLANIAVTRAGASTISELIALRVPAIIIPYPFAGGHQSMNAKILSDVEAATIIDEHSLSARILTEQLESFASDAVRIKQMKVNFERIENYNAVQNLAAEVLPIRRC
ncbi:MAG: undecaprenyldiphospho-muramoylpentapeptide beta-N-acetylglucosaminyltransferase [Candidatus Omnitrophica bacterium]|nr:undecaprenyldiphospho-muramoylpentapeptide beta-N-acetylglucosaminyltransferase [Candidatus Omnitrophota bacterium]